MPNAIASDWSETFIEGINSTDESGTIVLMSSAKLFYSPQNGQLPSKSVTDNGFSENGGACYPGEADSQYKKCKSSNNTLAKLPDDRINFEQCRSESSDNKFTTWSQKSIDIEGGEYGDVTLSGGGDRWVNFTTTDGIYKLKSLKASTGNLVLSSGQYWIGELVISSGVNITYPTDGSVSFFIGEDFNIVNKMLPVEPHELLLYGYKDINVGNVEVNAYIVAEHNLKVVGEINGAITANKEIYLNGGSNVTFTDKGENIDVTPNCDISLQDSNFQFGKATTGSVKFETKFPTGVTPLVFVMPTITSDDPANNDGPASVFLSDITNEGFTWSQVSPPGPPGRRPGWSALDPKPMTEIHWVATAAGEFEFTNGTKFQAGTKKINHVLYRGSGWYESVTLSKRYDVVLSQIQSANNTCWLTSMARLTSNGQALSIGMDVAEVVDDNGNGYWNKRCRQTDDESTKLNELVDEDIAFLAIEASDSDSDETIFISGKEVEYQFASGFSTLNSGSGSADQQCSYISTLNDFDNTPTFVAGKNSRYGQDGGWLRRCALTKNSVSMVTDEDQYQNDERTHLAEDYGFIALAYVDDSPELQCFNDNFNRDDLGSDWAIKTLGNSTAPAIESNRMRITPARGNQATSSTYQRLFPAADNFVKVEFDYYAWSPSSGTGGDGVAIILSDASITPQPGSFGGALGYAQRNNGTPGFAGGWMGVGLDEYGNFSNPTEGKIKGPGFRTQSVTIRGSANSNYMYLAGTAANLNPPIDKRSTNTASPNHRYRITVDSRVEGQALVLVERDIKDGNGFQVLVPEFDARDINGQGGVPADFYLSITGSTGGANNNHEIDNFEVCALDSNPLGQLVHHFEFDYSSSPLTCNAEDMTVRACRNANCDLFTDPVVANLSPAGMSNGGWVGGNVVNFVDGIARVSLRSNTNSPVTIGVSSSSPSTIAGSDTLCRQGAGSLSTARCTITFANSGFIFDIPDEFSNKPSTDIFVKAVKQGDPGLACIPAFANQSKPLQFWSDYIAPSTGTKKISVKSGTTEKEVGDSLATAETLILSFDEKGEAKIDVNYADAGNMQLNAKYTGSGDEAGLVMNGSNTFVRRPVGICLESVACTNCSVTSAPYKRAGEEFDITVKAMAWESDSDNDICRGNVTTPNFYHDNMLLSHELISPTIAEGGELGDLGRDEYKQTSGEQIITQTVSEVGIFTFSVLPKPGGYFGYDIPGATTDNMGRFTPYYLTVTPEKPQLQPSCGQFTYMDEPFLFKTGAEPKLLILGKNKDGNQTKNYQINDWWKYVNQWNGRHFSNLVGSTLPVLEELDAASRSVAFLDGTTGKARSAYLQKGTLRYNRTSALIVPFDAVFELNLPANDLKDSDGVCYQESPVSACIGVTFEDIAKDDAFVLRYGRLVMQNAYGPSSEELRLELGTEYVNANAEWVANNDDSCSVFDTNTTSASADTGLALTPQTGLEAVEGFTRSGGTGKAGTVGLGNSFIYFPAPSAEGEVALQLNVDKWLKWYWAYDISALEDPRATAYFGTYRGHDRIIYWREVN
ncbi:MSHA biogenesis protein MshQ [Shewanella gelidimarina]|uniref:DUF6701 domain-containing protein n=1 Tax=Shewanella gelidimarina TaxID=56813 RepID=UPI00200C4876|nr:DUF6701 domain-containing protein [Shewanella gelidimarina]MCL1057136.1 MSHA biogenesis protein MshQ [Shewanella gelidimarina]